MVVAALKPRIAVLKDHTPSSRPRNLDAVYQMELAFAQFTNELGDRQQHGCTRIDLTAQALRDIAAVYRRVDGQG